MSWTFRWRYADFSSPSATLVDPQAAGLLRRSVQTPGAAARCRPSPVAAICPPEKYYPATSFTRQYLSYEISNSAYCS